MTCQSWKCLPTVGPGTCLFPIRALPTEPAGVEQSGKPRRPFWEKRRVRRGKQEVEPHARSPWGAGADVGAALEAAGGPPCE